MKEEPVEILLVEDNPEDIDLAVEALKEERVSNHLAIVENGEEALMYLKKKGRYTECVSPDVIVLDLNLPKKNGFEVLDEMKQDAFLSQIPVIILTTSELTPEVKKKYMIEPHHYIRKNADFNLFVKAIRELQNGNSPKNELLHSQEKDVKDELNLLLVEDNLADVELLNEILFMKEKYDWHIKHVSRLQEATALLKTESFDVIILDLFLPDSHGLETLTQIVAYKKIIPVVVMTGLKDERMSLEAVRQGAQDYLIKGQITADLFLRTVRYAIERKHMELMKDELIGYVNHELNNPLTIIKEAISQIVEGILGDINAQQKQNLMSALSNIDRLIRITDELLDSTKLEFGKLPLEKEQFNIVEIAKKAVDSFQSSVSKKGLELRVQFSSDVITMYGDKNRIIQIFLNLLGNAIKFTSVGYIEVVLTDKDQIIECSIADTGEGISEENIPKLFQKFERIRHGDDTRIKGTGLGLFICEKLIEMHGGKITVKSQVGKGTKFTFVLPKGLGTGS